MDGNASACEVDDAQQECTAFAHKMCGDIKGDRHSEDTNLLAMDSAATNGHITPSTIGAEPHASAFGTPQPVHLSQDASSIFDISLAPHDDPPMWGDELDDFGEVAGILEDMDYLTSFGYETFGFQASSSEPKDASEKISSGPFSDGFAASAHDAVAAELGQGLTSNCATVGESGSNTAAGNRFDQDARTGFVNMDQRIFEDRVLMESFDSADSILAPFGNEGIFEEGIPSTPSPNQVPQVTPPDINSKQGPPATPLDANARCMTLAARYIPPATALKPGQHRPTAAITVTPPSNSSNIVDLSKGCTSLASSRKEESKGSLPPRSGLMRAAKPKTKQDVQHEALWNQRYLELEAYKHEHGTCNVPQKYQENPSLGAWVARQRLLMRQWEEQSQSNRCSHVDSDKSLVVKERAERLKSLGLESSIGKGALGKHCSYNANEWEKKYAELVSYRRVHGHADVPTKTTSLGRWVAMQRKKHRQFLLDEGKDRGEQLGWNEVLQKRFQRLRDLGFNFYVGKGAGSGRRRKAT